MHDINLLTAFDSQVWSDLEGKHAEQEMLLVLT